MCSNNLIDAAVAHISLHPIHGGKLAGLIHTEVMMLMSLAQVLTFYPSACRTCVFTRLSCVCQLTLRADHLPLHPPLLRQRHDSARERAQSQTSSKAEITHSPLPRSTWFSLIQSFDLRLSIHDLIRYWKFRCGCIGLGC